MKYEELVGQWKIRRDVFDFSGIIKGKMRGIGLFEPYEGNQLLYQEQLWHETPQGSLLFATKFYRYHFVTDQIFIYFYREENNRLFMTLANTSQSLIGAAHCKLDRYTLKWDWINSNHFLTRYEVKSFPSNEENLNPSSLGAKKNYIIESEYTR